MLYKTYVATAALVFLAGCAHTQTTMTSRSQTNYRELTPGTFTGITGDVKDLKSPVSDEPCVYYEFVAYARASGGEDLFLGRYKSGHAVPFMLEGAKNFVNFKNPEITPAGWEGYSAVTLTPGAESPGIKNHLAAMNIDAASFKGKALYIEEYCVKARHRYTLTVDEVSGSYLDDKGEQVVRKSMKYVLSSK